MLGLCARAGKLAYGADAAADAVRKGRASVVIMDAGAGPNTRKMLTNACQSHGARLIEAADVGRATGMTAAWPWLYSTRAWPRA